MKRITGIPRNGKRVVIVGGGFAGLKLAKSLRKSAFQIVLIDKNNYHQFQPLFYQVATAGLEPSAISFPLRKALQNQKNIHFRVADFQKVVAEENVIHTDIGTLEYDHLVLAIGADTNYFGNEQIAKHAIPMKSLTEAIDLRNIILDSFEKALNASSVEEANSLLNFVIVGAGPTGTELAGALAEMKKYILPKDYPEMDFELMKITVIEAAGKVLNGYSEIASKKGKLYLEKLGVTVHTKTFVEDYNGHVVTFADGESMATNNLIWAAGIKGNPIPGLEHAIGRGQRMEVDRFNLIKNESNIYALGDVAIMSTEAYENGHPQVAQVAIQQAALLSKNLKYLEDGKSLKKFTYKDKGSLATVGRNLAVADLPGLKFQGFLAWVLWLFVHLMTILGVKNRIFIFINWVWSYLTYDQSLRLLIKPRKKVSEKQVA